MTPYRKGLLAGVLAGIPVGMGLMALLWFVFLALLPQLYGHFQTASLRGAPVGLAAEAPVLGSTDYEWKLTDLKGGAAPLSEHRDQVLFVNVWASWCAPCRHELPGIRDLYASIDDPEIAFVLASDEERDVVADYVAEEGWELPVYLSPGDPTGIFATCEGSQSIPRTYIVDKRGNVRFCQLGAADYDTDAVRRFLADLAGS